MSTTPTNVGSPQSGASEFLTPLEVSQRYGGRISVRTLGNWRNLGTGPAFTKVGGKVLYPLQKLLAWETKNTVQSTSQYSKGET